jgi:hypothetical protein
VTAGMLSPLLQHDVERVGAFVPWPAFGYWQKAGSERLAREQSVTGGMLSPLSQHDVEQGRAFPLGQRLAYGRRPGLRDWQENSA